MSIIESFPLSDEQKAIVRDINNPVRVISGPGSGKTMTMVLKYLHLIFDMKYDPATILLLTFTNKAANEIIDRILKYSTTLGKKLDYSDMNVSTIHAFCKSVIDQNPEIHANRPSFDVLDEIGQATVMLGLAEDYLYKSRVGACKEIVDSIVPYLNKITDENLSTESVYEFLRVKLRGLSHMEDKEITLIKNAIHLNALYPIYEKAIDNSNFIDFPHMQKLVYDNLVQNVDLLDKLKTQFKYIIIDEYQDTSFLQNEILMMISEPGYNFTVCGDDDQAIYRFRGATVKNFLALEERVPSLKSYYLSTNYRARANLVELTNSCIKHNNGYRLPKRIESSTPQVGFVGIEKYSSAIDEVEAITQNVRKLVKDKNVTSYGDVAILFRSINSFALELVKSFRDNHIPFIVKGIDKYESSSVIQSIVAILNFVVDAKCYEINLSDNELFRNTTNLSEINPNEDYCKHLCLEDAEYIEVLTRIKNRLLEKDYHSNLAVFYDILQNNKLVRSWIVNEDFLKLQDLGYLSNIFNLFDTVHKRTDPYLLNALIQHLVMKGIEEGGSDLSNSVQIMTIHQAKGLEFPCVIMPNQIKVPVKTSKFSMLDTLFNYEVDDSQKISELDERKVFYVGATRAERILILTYSDKSFKLKGQKISPFLKELDSQSNGTLTKANPIKSIENQRLALSFSQIKTYMDCPRKYYLAYIVNLSTVQQAEVYFGLSMHRALDKIHKQIQQNVDLKSKDIKVILQSNWISIYRRKKDDKDLFDKGLAYLNSYYANESLSLTNRIVSSELPFKHLFDDIHVYLNGVIDLVVTDGNARCKIIDFKLSSIDPTVYDKQMQLYGYIYGTQANRDIDSLELYSIADGTKRSIQFSEQEVTQIKELVRDVSHSINSAIWTATKNRQSCRSCPYKSLCDKNSS